MTSVHVVDWDPSPKIVEMQFEDSVPQQQIDFAFEQWDLFDTRIYKARPFNAVQADILALSDDDWRELMSMMAAEWLVAHPDQAERLDIPVGVTEPTDEIPP